jgi:RimJ/RimL family protein N-acetyltransferase
VPAEQPDLVLRPITGPEELDLFCRLPYVLNEELAEDLAAGRRRPAWMWVALRGGQLLARAAWWGSADGTAPQLMDVLDVLDSEPDSLDIAERLLRTALPRILPPGTADQGTADPDAVHPETAYPEYGRFIPTDWQTDPASRRTVEGSIEVLQRLGGRLLVERLRLEWPAGGPVPEPSGRLAFRAVRDDAELIELMVRVQDGTLDAHSQADLARMTPREAARSHFEEELAKYASPRAWWRIATLPDGTPVGFVIPARNSYNPIIAYLAVLPEHRGNGYIDEILGEGTRVLARERDVPRIRASTDLGNVPMANAFRRAGYLNFERSISVTWS